MNRIDSSQRSNANSQWMARKVVKVLSHQGSCPWELRWRPVCCLSQLEWQSARNQSRTRTGENVGERHHSLLVGRHTDVATTKSSRDVYQKIGAELPHDQLPFLVWTQRLWMNFPQRYWDPHSLLCSSQWSGVWTSPAACQQMNRQGHRTICTTACYLAIKNHTMAFSEKWMELGIFMQS